jgi:hypothetical protein
MTKFLKFIALVAVSVVLYLTMCLGSWFATWFAAQPYGWVTIPLVIFVIVKISKAAFSKEGEN